MELRESAVLDLRINGKTVVNDLDEISGKISDLRTAQKGMLDDIGNAAKGTAAYKDLAKEIKSLEVDFKQVRTEMGLQGMTMKQLDAYTKDLNKELKDLVPGTTAYVNKAKEIGEVNTHVRAVRESTAELTGSVKQSESTWSQLKLWIMGAFSATVIFEAARAIFDFFRDSVKEARAFETAAQSLSAVTGATGKDLEFYKQQAMEVGPAMGKSAAEMLKAYELIGSAKPELLSNKEALAALTQEAILLSQAARIDLTEASEVLAGSLNQFGEAADQSNRFVNVLAAGVTYGSASIKEMGSSLKAAGTVASAAGLSFEETNAAIQSLATITLKGEQSGTMFRNMLLTLQAGADDTNPKVVGLEKAIENLGKKNLSAAELTKMFGKENFVAAQYLITHGAQVSDLTKKLTGTSEATLQAGKNTDTLDFKIQKATATFKNISLEMGSKLAPAVGKVIDFFIDLVENSDPLIIAFETVYEVFGTVFELLGDAVRVLFPNFTTGGNTMQKVLQALGTIVVSIVAPIKIFAGVLMDVIKLMTILQDGAAGVGKILTGDFAGAAESFSKAKTAIGEFGNATKTAFTSVGDAYKKIWTDAPGHVKDGTDKSTTVQTNANKTDEANHAKSMDNRTEKQKQAAEKQRQKAEEEAKKEGEARVKAADDAADRIDKLNIELIADEKQRKIQLLAFEFEKHAEKIQREKTDEKTKNAEIELLRKQLTNNITQLENDYRAKYLAEEEKKRKDNEARERETRELRAKAEFETSKAIIEREMADKSISIEARKKLTLALLELEQREELRKIAEVAAREREQAQGNADAIVAIDNNEKAQRDAVHLQFLAKQRDAQAAALAEKQAQWQQFLGVLSGLLQGDMTNFLAYLKQKTDANMANISQEKQSQLSKFTEIAGYAQAALNTMSELSKMYHEKQLQKIEAEKQAQVDKWKELYDNGKITKEEFNEAIKKLDDEYAEKKRIEMHKEWQRQKIMALTQTAIQGALAIVSAFTLGPIAGAIAAVAVGITIAKQVKEINAQEPPKFAKGGIPRGPGHDQGGIKLVNSRTGQIEGEMEGGEPYMILSRNTYRNNKGVIDRLLHSSLHRNGEPIYAKGGLFGSLDENGRIIRKYKDGGMVQPIDEDYGGDIGGGGGGFDDPGFQAPAITDPAPYFDQLSKQADDSFDLTIMKFDLLASRMADMIEINKTMIALQQQTNAKLSDVSSNIQQIANRPIVVSVPLQKIDEAQSNQQAVNESSTLSPG